MPTVQLDNSVNNDTSIKKKESCQHITHLGPLSSQLKLLDVTLDCHRPLCLQ